MGKKKRNYVEKHKQSLGDQLENPETYGVRVSAHSVWMAVGSGGSTGAVPPLPMRCYPLLDVAPLHSLPADAAAAQQATKK
jgi:hypothetical protein